MHTLGGKLVPRKIRIGIVASHFNEFIISKLLSGALDRLWCHEVPENVVMVAWAPGTFETPSIAPRTVPSRCHDVAIYLGAVIWDSTSHYSYMCGEVPEGTAQTPLIIGVPAMFDALTTGNIEQAIERAGAKAGNKGCDCAAGAVEMINLIHELRQRMADDSSSVTPPVQSANS